jgi:hypothetical protein
MDTLNFVKKSMVVLIGGAFITLPAVGAAQATTLTPNTFIFDTSNNPFRLNTDPLNRRSQGSYTNNTRSTTAGANRNDVYVVGNQGPIPLRSYFTFDLRNVQFTDPIESVTLELTRFRSGPQNQTVTLGFSEVSTDPFTLNKTRRANAAIFEDLGDDLSYGLFQVSTGSNETVADFSTIKFTLNSTAIAAIQKKAGGFFSIGGSLVPQSTDGQTALFGSPPVAPYDKGIQRLTVTTRTTTPPPATVPEPSTVAAILLTGLGILRYGKRQRQEVQER